MGGWVGGDRFCVHWPLDSLVLILCRSFSSSPWSSAYCPCAAACTGPIANAHPTVLPICSVQLKAGARYFPVSITVLDQDGMEFLFGLVSMWCGRVGG